MAAVYQVENIQTSTEAALRQPMPWDGCNDRLRREADSLTSIENPARHTGSRHGTDTDENHSYAMPIAAGRLDRLRTKGSSELTPKRSAES